MWVEKNELAQYLKHEWSKSISTLFKIRVKLSVFAKKMKLKCELIYTTSRIWRETKNILNVSEIKSICMILLNILVK